MYQRVYEPEDETGPETEDESVASPTGPVDPAVAEALGVFVAAHWDDMVAFGHMRLRDYHAAEDAASEAVRCALPTWHVAMTRAAEAPTPAQADMKLRLYLYRILNQRVMDSLRRRKVRENTLSLDYFGYASAAKSHLAPGSQDPAVDGNNYNTPVERLLVDDSPEGGDPTLTQVCQRETLEELRALTPAHVWVTVELQAQGWTLAEVASVLPASITPTGVAKTAGALKTDQSHLHHLARAARARDFAPVAPASAPHTRTDGAA